MALTNQTKVLLVLAAVFVLLYILYQRNGESYSEENNVEEENNIIQNMEETTPEEVMMQEESIAPEESVASSGTSCDAADWKQKNVPLPRDEMLKHFPKKDYAPPESDWLFGKFNSRNKAQWGKYKRSNYSGAKRGNIGPASWDDYFDHNNNVIGNAQTGENDKFLPMDETNNGYAVFKSKGRATCGSNQNCEPEDLFDVDKYLPQEVNDDWFEVQPEPISVKNRHLINITKPIGINTIGTSNKNMSYDIRSAPAVPKLVVSPWLQSSIDPDVNLKPMM